MVKNTEKARAKAEEKWKKQEEERAIELYDYLEDKPNQTIYSLSKKFNYSLKSTENIINKLIEEGLIKIKQIMDNGRTKNIVNILEFEDYTFEDYNEENITDEFLEKLIERTKATGVSVYIHRKDGSKIELSLL
ncbi:MAG: hypothetical protein HeimC3_34050 [Candidatus Heimdallarchaeota archaeon LC_3]|nr:MAG: hypothetical protein HeimC3_34050 [Candidatus Heimdallarchaeota archaeon LC_3]